MDRTPERRVVEMDAPLDTPLAATTTRQEDMTTAGQRKVNLIWEFTQATVAVLVVATSCIVAASLAINGRPNDFPPILTGLVMLIVGAYFSRTNHAAIGGIGPKPSPKYEGR
jgi:xanthine/uracil permease